MHSLRRPRQGVSLMEVLIAIFVIAFGLLGIAAIIPVGRVTVNETAKSDRCGAAGRAALREVRTRRMLDPFPSLTGEPQGWVNPQGFTIGALAAAEQFRGFCIDPLLLTHLGPADRRGIPIGFPNGNMSKPNSDKTAENVSIFPSRSVLQASVGGTYFPVTLWRMSLNCVTLQSQGVYRPLPDLARRIFTWQDEWIFDDPGMQARPRQMFTFNTGQVRELPFRIEVGADNAPLPPASSMPMLRETQGSYTWMLTITANPAEVAAAASYQLATGLPMAPRLRSFVVSVVVYYRRAIREPLAEDEIPTERALRVQSAALGKGMGGGNLLVSLDAALSQDQKEKWLNINAGDWLLLCGQYSVTPAGSQGGQNSQKQRFPLQSWYRVISANTATATQDSRMVTVVGPDWEVPMTQTDMLMAVFPTNVVGVYTTIMDLDVSSLMGK